MNAAPDPITNDPLGYERFALTESAYDLITSLTGIYAQLRFKERQETMPDVDQISVWQGRINELQRLYKQGDWSDISVLEKLIAELAVEYRDCTTAANTSIVSFRPIASGLHVVHKKQQT